MQCVLARLGGGFEFRMLTSQIDAKAVLSMKKDELIDVVITSHWETFPQPVGMRTLQNARLMTAHLSRRDVRAVAASLSISPSCVVKWSQRFRATGSGCREVVALKQQGRVHGRGKRVGRAVGKIEPLDALAVAVKSDGGGMHLHFVERNDFNRVVCQPLPKLRDGHDAVATAQNTRGFMGVAWRGLRFPETD